MPNIYIFNYFYWSSKVLILNKLKGRKKSMYFKTKKGVKKAKNYSPPTVLF